MSNQLTNQPTYADRLAALSHAANVALSNADDTTRAVYLFTAVNEEAAEIAYVNLWDALLNALITHADCDHAELLGIVAGTLQMRVPVPVVTVGPVPVIGTVGPDGNVSWNSGGLL